MRGDPVRWTVLSVLGVLLWLASAEAVRHPVWRLVVMLALFSCFVYVVWNPRSR